MDVIVRVHGGGITGQAGAICQGVARAVKTMFSPRNEQKVITKNHVTIIRAFKAEAKPGTHRGSDTPSSGGQPRRPR